VVASENGNSVVLTTNCNVKFGAELLERDHPAVGKIRKLDLGLLKEIKGYSRLHL
jgi:hypothetical protein